MKQSRCTEAQIIGILKEQEAGTPTAEVCRKHGMNSATFYKYKARFGGNDVSEAQRLKTLEDCPPSTPMEHFSVNEGWPAFEAALKSAGTQYEAFIYPGANHGFQNDTI